VVVATRDRVGRLRRLLDSLDAQTVSDFEVIVVDDGSVRHGPAAELARRHGFRHVRRDASGGPSAARNDGWPLARAPLVAFIDDDCVATPGWLEALLAASGPVVQGRTLPEAGELGPFTRSLWVEEPGPYYQACNILYPRTLLEELGGFDADAFPHVGEDTDLAWRALAAGATIDWAPDALVHHAVIDLGPLGKLRMAARWTPSIRLFARHRALRSEHLTYGIFWKGTHYLLVRFLIALAVRRRSRWLALWLAAPYVRNLLLRGTSEGGGPAAAPYHLLHDLVELVAVVRGAVRYRTPVV
jgi:GT2 family glycosyltransferase